MASADEEDDLTCGLCLNTYKSPKFLPCHHTFCEGCLVSLDEKKGNNPLVCPKCGQTVQLPAGGVSQLVSNYYITPLLNAERCQLHRTEKLRFYCRECSTALCVTCKLTDHDKHEAGDLGKALHDAKTELEDCQGKLEKGESTLNDHLVQLQEHIFFSTETCENLKRLVDERLEGLTRRAKECRDDLVSELETSFRGLRGSLQQDERGVQERLSALRALQQEVTQGLQGAGSHALLTLASDMRTGRGSQPQLDQLTSDLPLHTERPVLGWDDECLQRDVIRQFLGHVEQFQPNPIQQSVTVREVFRCCQDTQLYVHAICVDLCFNDVNVAYGFSGAGGEGRVVGYTQSEETVHEAPIIKGRVCLGDLNAGCVRVEGKEFTAQDLIFGSFSPCGNTAEGEREYNVYNKGRVRFMLRVHTSGCCDLRSVTIEEYTMTTDSKVCEVRAKNPTAMDVSKDGQLLAVLEEGQDHVMLYRHGDSEPYATYRGNGTAFRPLDVCFYLIGGAERLVVADWLNDSLHVVAVHEGCTLIGHVGGQCPVMVKPTALCVDREGRLWVGCQGGHILTLTQP